MKALPNDDSYLRQPTSQLAYPEDSCWQTALSCVPVICIVMQQLNRRWIAKQEANLNELSPQYLERKKNLLEKAIKYEKNARVGHVITTLAIGIIVILAHTLVPVLVFGGLELISFHFLRNTASRLEQLRKDLADTETALKSRPQIT